MLLESYSICDNKEIKKVFNCNFAVQALEVTLGIRKYFWNHLIIFLRNVILSSLKTGHTLYVKKLSDVKR